VPATAPIDLHLDVGVVRAGDGVGPALVQELVPLVARISEDVGRVVDLTASSGRDGPRRWIELDCWLAGLATVTASGSGRTVDQALVEAKRELLRGVAAVEVEPRPSVAPRGGCA